MTDLWAGVSTGGLKKARMVAATTGFKPCPFILCDVEMMKIRMAMLFLTYLQAATATHFQSDAELPWHYQEP